jgi:hypothetical protein
MYVIVKILVRADMNNNLIKCKIVCRKNIHMHFHFERVLTFVPFCTFVLKPKYNVIGLSVAEIRSLVI